VLFNKIEINTIYSNKLSKPGDNIMEALVYVFLLTGTLMVIFFAIFFRDPPRIAK
jgi:hypothetical protein